MGIVLNFKLEVKVLKEMLSKSYKLRLSIYFFYLVSENKVVIRSK
jgi:hypothetical protein